jgi:hypothetical protein
MDAETRLLKKRIRAAKPVGRLGAVKIFADDRTVWAVVSRHKANECVIRCFETKGALSRVNFQDDSITATAEEGDVEIVFAVDPVRVTTRVKPTFSILLHAENRDAFLMSPGDVRLSQKECSTGWVFGSLGSDGAYLYFQNFTALNEFFRDSGARPRATVGGLFPHIGYRRPEAVEPFRSGKWYTILDTFIDFAETNSRDELAMAEAFLIMLDRIYSKLDKPETEYFDWQSYALKAERTLKTSDLCSIRIEGKKYLLPYVGGSRPDSLAQFRTLSWLSAFDLFRGEQSSLREELSKTVPTFINQDEGRPERFPCFGDNDCGQTAKIDTWYAFYSLLNLAEIAKSGDVVAFESFQKTLEYIVKVAHEFDYDFPVFFDGKSLKVIQQDRGETKNGQSDVAGLYAWIVLHACDLTHESKYVEEAKKALKATPTFGFELAYQTNITAWGAAAAYRIWHETKDETFLKIGNAYLACMLRYCNYYEPDYGKTEHFPSFGSLMALSSCEYPAILENADSVCAIGDIIRRCDIDLPDHISRLMNEFYKHALHHSRFYFADQLPEEILAKEPREGKIVPALPIPVEDLYLCGEKSPGEVGQEVYGSGAAFALAVNTTLMLKGLGLKVIAEVPAHAIESKKHAEIQISGRPQNSYRITIDGPNLKGVWMENGATTQLGRRKPPVHIDMAGGSTLRLGRN